MVAHILSGSVVPKTTTTKTTFFPLPILDRRKLLSTPFETFMAAAKAAVASWKARGQR